MMNTHIFPLVACTALAANAAASTVLYVQDFEASGPGSGYSTTNQYITTPHYTHFLHTDGSALPISNYTNTTGSFISGFNTDWFLGHPTLGTPTLTTDSFDITGVTNLQFAIDLASNTTTPHWTATSQVTFEYRVDGGAWIDIFTADSAGVHMGNPMVDGVAITNAFTTFTADISGLTGTTMEIQVVWANLSTLESLAIDNMAVSVIPLPPAGFAGLGMLAGLGIYRRIRR